MTTSGTFTGVGVGPGPAGFITVAALQALQRSDIILLPRARHALKSVAGQCLEGLDLPPDKIVEIVYNMDPDRSALRRLYARLARLIADELQDGQNVAYLTIGDALTYSTYSYTLEELLKILPGLVHQTYPGVTSFAATAAALDWPLGQGKERTLILPCPDDVGALRLEIETHDIVVVMKVGHRLPDVLALLDDMQIAPYCAFASRLGLPGEFLCKRVSELNPEASHDYLTTMLIRKNHPGGNV